MGWRWGVIEIAGWGGAQGAGLGRPAQCEKEQARGELSPALVLASADGLSQDGIEGSDSLQHPFLHLTLLICPKGTPNITLGVRCPALRKQPPLGWCQVY